MIIKHDLQSGFKPCFANGSAGRHRQNNKQRGRQRQVGPNGLDNHKLWPGIHVDIKPFRRQCNKSFFVKLEARALPAWTKLQLLETFGKGHLELRSLPSIRHLRICRWSERLVAQRMTILGISQSFRWCWLTVLFLHFRSTCQAACHDVRVVTKPNRGQYRVQSNNLTIDWLIIIDSITLKYLNPKVLHI